MASATRTHYDLLEVPSDADQAAIKAAYNKLRRPLHPDMPGGSATLFGMVAEAYEVLGDPQKRAEYDRYLAAGGDRGAHTKQATEAARATEAAHAAERARLETLLRLAEAQAQGRPTPETGDAHADEVAQYVELLRRMDLNREQARRAEEERENSRQDWLAAANGARVRARATRRARYRSATAPHHPLRLVLPMVGAVLLGAVLSHQLDGLGLGRTPAALNPTWWLAAALRISGMALAGGYLIVRRNAMSRLRVRDTAAICAAWGLVTALSDRLPAIFGLLGVGGTAAELLPVVVTAVALMLTGLRAAGRNTGGPLPTLWCATKEALICVKDALLVVPRCVGAAL